MHVSIKNSAKTASAQSSFWLIQADKCDLQYLVDVHEILENYSIFLKVKHVGRKTL